MSFGVYFAAQDFRGTCHGQISHVLTQYFLGAKHFLLDFCFGADEDATAFILGGPLCFLNDLGSMLLCLGNNVGSPLLGLLQHVGGTVAGQLQFMLATFARRQTVGDGFLAVFNRTHQRRPDKFDRKPDEYGKSCRLRKKGEIDVHG